ncbi:MAG: hypothetical protein H0W08_11195 [Acidobacteria bacterium]|nr:hypothetical protein [Acidobacteriota bacterium]
MFAFLCGTFVILPLTNFILTMKSSVIIVVALCCLLVIVVFGTALLILAMAGLWGLVLEWGAEPLEYAAGATGLALWPIWSLFLLGFGWEVAVASFFLDVFAEATPRGRWELHHLGPPEHWGSESVARPMRHAFLHDDPRVFAAVVVWIQESSQRMRQH